VRTWVCSSRCVASHAAAQDTIRLVVVEDHPALRRGLELLLERQGCVLVGSAGGADDGWNLIREHRPDVSIIDVNLPDRSGVALAKQLLAEDPELGVLLYTGAAGRTPLREALESGARGIALKAAPTHELIDAIRTVARGGVYVDVRLTPLLDAGAAEHRADILSPREREILVLLSTGLTGEDVAAQLFLSPETVRTHVRNAVRKLDAKTRSHAVAIAMQRGEIDY
jgi:DNA-binding NarL/FixJ family response regulator